MGTVRRTISIHALLAESDRLNAAGAFSIKHFYPRSPCGERLGLLSPTDPRQTISIHALLAESDYCHAAGGGKDDDFYPRSPCGERPFLIISLPSCGNFYPRSPCGERRPLKAGQTYYCEFLSTLSLRRATVTVLGIQHRVGISIHALLAESDAGSVSGISSGIAISIHALLAESDPLTHVRSPSANISIHALLAESDRPQHHRGRV